MLSKIIQLIVNVLQYNSQRVTIQEIEPNKFLQITIRPSRSLYDLTAAIILPPIISILPYSIFYFSNKYSFYNKSFFATIIYISIYTIMVLLLLYLFVFLIRQIFGEDRLLFRDSELEISSYFLGIKSSRIIPLTEVEEMKFTKLREYAEKQFFPRYSLSFKHRGKTIRISNIVNESDKFLISESKIRNQSFFTVENQKLA